MRINEQSIVPFGLIALLAGLFLFMVSRSNVDDVVFYFWMAVIVMGAIGAGSVQVGRDFRPKNLAFGLVVGFGVALLGLALLFLLVGLFGSPAEAEERIFTTIAGGLVAASGLTVVILGLGLGNRR